MANAEFLAALSSVLEGNVTIDPDELVHYGRDWTRVHAPEPCAVAFPKNTSEVSKVLALARTHNIAVVPSGGRTGLAAGAVAKDGELVLSLRRMNHIATVDEVGLTVRAEAGAVTAAIHEHVAPKGLTWPVDFASKGSSTVGGNIATNAGGVRVIRYGLTRQWVLGLQVVLSDGRVLELGGALEKNNTGIDLRQLFIGSEGILGIITEATLKLTRLPGKVEVFLFAVPSLEAVLQCFAQARRGPFTVMAFEFFTAACLARVARHRKTNAPFAKSHPYYVLLEVEAAEQESLETWMSDVTDSGSIVDGILAQDSSQARALWDLREGISESLSATGRPHKNDIALPIAELHSFVDQLDSVFATKHPGFEICLFGHIGDGNLHVNIMKPDAMSNEDFVNYTHASDHVMFELVQKHHGSISAEHGIGLLKKDFLHYSRSEAELVLMRQMKQILDPNNTLNPGKVL